MSTEPLLHAPLHSAPVAADPGVEATVVETLLDLLDLDSAPTTADPLRGIEGWDSVNSLRVLVFLEQELGVTLDVRAFLGAASVGDLVEVVATGTAVR